MDAETSSWTTMRTRRGFTLIELLVVIAIIGILAAILFPVIAKAKSAAYQLLTIGYLRQVGSASSMYRADHDETFMPGMGYDGTALYGWYGRHDGATVDDTSGLLVPYRGKRKITDPIAKAKEYRGDHSGFGYNWGYLGSDIHLTGRYGEYPYCWRPAHASELAHPSTTVEFATSSYYFASWEGGDGVTYDFGFIDPIGMRPDNPNIDFRHMDTRKIDPARKRVSSEGRAVVSMTDGSARSITAKGLVDAWFDPNPLR